MQAEKKVQWQAAEGEDAAAKEELKKEESSESEEEEQEEITGCLLPQDLSKLDVAALTPLTPEVIRCCAFPASLSQHHAGGHPPYYFSLEPETGVHRTKNEKMLTAAKRRSTNKINSLMLKCTVGKRRLTWGPLVTWHTASQRLSRPCPVSWSRLTPQPLKPKLWG